MQITCQHKNLSKFFWNINIFNSNSNVFIFLYKKIKPLISKMKFNDFIYGKIILFCAKE